jgi:hypothetical protein
MAETIERIWLIQTTSTAKNSRTDAKHVKLILSGHSLEFHNIGELNEREPGGSDQYEFAIGTLGLTRDDLTPDKIRISFEGSPGGENAWLPKSFWVIGKVLGRDEYVLLVAHPSWPNTSWFSTQPDAGAAVIRDLNGNAC